MTSFEADLSRFATKAMANVDIVRKKIILDLFTRVIRRTPVLTGRARANWLASTSQPALRVVDVADAVGSATIAAMQSTVDQSAFDSVLYLVNNLDYIIFLEGGSSQRAPTGMVAVTLREYPLIVERAAGIVR